MKTSFQRTYASKLQLPGLFYSVPLTPSMASYCWPTPLLGDSWTLTGKSGSVSWGSLLLSPGSWWAQDFICALWESVSPVLWKFCSQIPLAFKVKFPRGLSTFARTLAAVQKPFGITVLQFVGHLLGSSMVGLMVTSCKKTFPHTMPPRSAAAGDPVSTEGLCWSMPLQEALKPIKAALARSLVGSLGPGAHKV